MLANVTEIDWIIMQQWSLCQYARDLTEEYAQDLVELINDGHKNCHAVDIVAEQYAIPVRQRDGYKQISMF